MILARERVFCFNYFQCFFLLVVVVLLIMLYSTFRSVRVFSFYLFF
jgi:hypothetical protein